MLKSNRKLKNAIAKIDREHSQLLADTVREIVDRRGSELRNRADLFYQVEPFAREFDEYGLIDPGDRPDWWGFTMALRLTSIGKKTGLKKYRAMFFAWLSYYHPQEAETFCEKIGQNIPMYEGHPDLTECSEKAKSYFDRQSQTADNESFPRPDPISSSSESKKSATFPLTSIDDLGLQQAFCGFFGQQPASHEGEREALVGDWVMYRQLSTDIDKYIASHMTISEGDAGTLIVRDKVLIDNDDDERGWIEEVWEGFLFNAGRFDYYILRMPDLHRPEITNVKFMLLGNKQAQKPETHGSKKLYFRMDGYTTIMMNRIGEPDIFGTVVQRADNPEQEPFGVIRKDGLSDSVKRRMRELKKDG